MLSLPPGAAPSRPGSQGYLALYFFTLIVTGAHAYLYSVYSLPLFALLTSLHHARHIGAPLALFRLRSASPQQAKNTLKCEMTLVLPQACQ